MNTMGDTLSRAGLPTAARAKLDQRLVDRVSYSQAVCSQHGQSESHFPACLPDAVVFAESTEDVVFVVDLCADHGIKLTAFGAGTSIEGNALPIQGGISLDMSRMNRVLAVNAEDFDVTVQAGVTRLALNNHLRDSGLFFPVDPGADATIGGMASTRASGTNAVRYGTMREAVLSLRVVTADGRDIRTAGRARKSAAGYDLTRLFVGAEGTLGIITEVTLRLHPIPEVISAAVCGFDTIEGAATSVIQAIQLGVPLARVEILDDMQMRAVNRWSKLNYPEKTTLFFEFHGSQASVDEQVATVRNIADANGGGSFDWSSLPEERSRLWKARHEAYWATIGLRPGSVGWATDVCVPIGRLADCITETKQDLANCSVPATICGHVGDGNFHVCFALDPLSSDEREEVEMLNARLISRALAMHGTCTGEHGIGLGKQAALIEELGEGVDVMRRIKRALDPAGIFNPGKIFSLS